MKLKTSGMQWQHREPMPWICFALGGTLAAFIFPALVLIVGLLVPLGLMPETTFSFDRVHAFASHWAGALILLAILALLLLHAAHRIFHGLHDIGLHPGNGARLLTYGAAIFTSAGVAIVLSTL